jgi:SAM-dependent methyltransferase
MTIRDDMFNADPVTERHRLSRQARVYMEPIRERARRLAGERIVRILDIGCGSGELSMVLREVFPEAQVVAVDRDQMALAMAQRITEDRGVTGIEYIAADAETELPEGPFDLVLASMVLYHTRRPERLLGNAYAALAPGGRFWSRDPLPVARDENVIYAQRLLHVFLAAAEAVSANLQIAPRIPALLADAGFLSVELEREAYPLGGPTIEGQELARNIIEAAYQARALIAGVAGLTDEVIQEMYWEAVRALTREGDKVVGTQHVVNHVARKGI